MNDAKPPWSAPMLTDEQVDRLRAEFLRKMRKRGKVKILNPPPWHVRLRLAVESAVNHAGTRLVYHGHYGAAERLWRLFGMWR